MFLGCDKNKVGWTVLNKRDIIFFFILFFLFKPANKYKHTRTMTLITSFYYNFLSGMKQKKTIQKKKKRWRLWLSTVQLCLFCWHLKLPKAEAETQLMDTCPSSGRTRHAHLTNGHNWFNTWQVLFWWARTHFWNKILKRVQLRGEVKQVSNNACLVYIKVFSKILKSVPKNHKQQEQIIWLRLPSNELNDETYPGEVCFKFFTTNPFGVVKTIHTHKKNDTVILYTVHAGTKGTPVSPFDLKGVKCFCFTSTR